MDPVLVLFGFGAALGIVMFTSGLVLLNKAGDDVPARVLVAVPAALGAGSWAILRACRGTSGRSGRRSAKSSGSSASASW